MSCFDPKTILKVLKNHQPVENWKEFEQQWVKEVCYTYFKVIYSCKMYWTITLGRSASFEMASSTEKEEPTLSCWAGSIRGRGCPVRRCDPLDDEDQSWRKISQKDDGTSVTT